MLTAPMGWLPSPREWAGRWRTKGSSELALPKMPKSTGGARPAPPPKRWPALVPRYPITLPGSRPAGLTPPDHASVIRIKRLLSHAKAPVDAALWREVGDDRVDARTGKD